MNYWLMLLLILIVNILLDVLAVKFTEYTVKQERMKAGLASVALTIFGWGTLYVIIESPINIIPAAVGSFIGCYWGIKKV
jgi:uncharacterized protein YebE (UPF0316 family)